LEAVAFGNDHLHQLTATGQFFIWQEPWMLGGRCGIF
jgi:hypothetical protein